MMNSRLMSEWLKWKEVEVGSEEDETIEGEEATIEEGIEAGEEGI